MTADNCFIIKDGELIEYIGKGTVVNIPLGVKKIAPRAFLGNSEIIEVNIPQSVRSIGWNAFYNCTALERISIPDGIEDVGKNAFLGTPWLSDCTREYLVFGDTLYHSNSRALSVAVPYGIRKIAPSAFSGNGMLSVEMPETVELIGDKAFQGCENLKSLVIPKGVKKIGNSAFYGCKSLESVIISDTVFDIAQDAFLCCELLLDISVPVHIDKLCLWNEPLKKLKAGKSVFDALPEKTKKDCSMYYLLSENEFSDTEKFGYEEYIKNNGVKLMQYAVDTGNTAALERLSYKGTLTAENIGVIGEYAASHSSTDAVMLLLEYRRVHFSAESDKLLLV